MSSLISTGQYAIVDRFTSAENVYANCFVGTNLSVETISTTRLHVNSLMIPQNVPTVVGTPHFSTTIRASTITIGNSQSTVIFPGEIRYVSRETFIFPDPNVQLNLNGITTVGAGLTILQQNVLCQPAYVKIDETLGWTLSCPTGTLLAQNISATSYVAAEQFLVGSVAMTLSNRTTSDPINLRSATGILTVNGTISAMNMTLVNNQVFNTRITAAFVSVKGPSTILSLSTGAVRTSIINYATTYSVSTTYTNALVNISLLSVSNAANGFTLNTPSLWSVRISGPTNMHVNTVASIQHMRVLSMGSFGTNLNADTTTIANLSTERFVVTNDVTIMALSTPIYNFENTPSISLLALVVNDTATIDTGANVLLDNVYMQSVGTYTTTFMSIFVARVAPTVRVQTSMYMGVSAGITQMSVDGTTLPLSIRFPADFSTTNVVAQTISCGGILSTQIMTSASTMSAGVYMTTQSLYPWSLRMSNLVVSSLTVNQVVSARTVILGSALEFNTGVGTQALRYDYGSVATNVDGWGTITFTQPFAQPPTVIANIQTSNPGFTWVTMANSPTLVGVTSLRTYLNRVPVGPRIVNWTAIGV
jgi:hypothetical protein